MTISKVTNDRPGLFKMNVKACNREFYVTQIGATDFYVQPVPGVATKVEAPKGKFASLQLALLAISEWEKDERAVGKGKL